MVLYHGIVQPLPPPALDDLLSESAPQARLRSLALWDTLWSPGTPLVLHGAGNAGLRTLHHLRCRGIEPLGFADASPGKQGTLLEGLPVLSPPQAARTWGPQALFLVTVLNREHSYSATAAAYAGLGGCRTAPVLAYYWAHPGDFLPHFAFSSPETVLEARDEILEAYAALSDADSRAHLLGYLKWRLHLDYAALPGPCGETMYFPESLVALQGPQCFVDCGAYDGDTLRDFHALAGGGLEEAHLFEPDPANLSLLASRIQDLPPALAAKVSTHPLAVGAGPGTLRFHCGEGEASALSPTGQAEVRVAALDDVLAGVTPTFIKMDIEGAEPEALQGASTLIRSHAPTLAICVYHRPGHPWQIPLTLSRLLPRHRIALRPHAADGCEWVAYAVPN